MKKLFIYAGFVAMIVGMITVSALLPKKYSEAQTVTSYNVSGYAFSDMPNASDQVVTDTNYYGGRGLGKIEMSGSGYQVTLSSNGKFSGYAWNEIAGFVSFDGIKVDQSCLDTINSSCDVAGDIVFIAAKNTTATISGGWDGIVRTNGSWNNTVKLGKSINGVRTMLGYAWGGDVVGWVDFSNVKITIPVITPVDECPNISGNQLTVPQGYKHDSNGDCIPNACTLFGDIAWLPGSNDKSYKWFNDETNTKTVSGLPATYSGATKFTTSDELMVILQKAYGVSIATTRNTTQTAPVPTIDAKKILSTPLELSTLHATGITNFTVSLDDSSPVQRIKFNALTDKASPLPDSCIDSCSDPDALNQGYKGSCCYKPNVWNKETKVCEPIKEDILCPDGSLAPDGDVNKCPICTDQSSNYNPVTKTCQTCNPTANAYNPITGFCGDQPSQPIKCLDGTIPIKGVCPKKIIIGCTDPHAKNYNSAATMQDNPSSCIYDPGVKTCKELGDCPKVPTAPKKPVYIET